MLSYDLKRFHQFWTEEIMLPSNGIWSIVQNGPILIFSITWNNSDQVSSQKKRIIRHQFKVSNECRTVLIDHKKVTK